MTDWTPLKPGDALRHWAASTAREVHFPGTPRPMPDTVDYRFRNGWVDTGPLPCREALLAALPDRDIPCPHGPFDRMEVAGDGDDLDFSTFRFRPTLITRAFTCRMRGDGPARFDLATCGGVRIWLDGTPLAIFEPFDRNTPRQSIVTLPLTPQAQTLTLRLEDLHERDTVNFFALRLMQGDAVEYDLPPGFDTQAALAAMRALSSVRTNRVFYDGDTPALIADTPLTVILATPQPFERGGINAPPQGAPQTLTLGPDPTPVNLPEASPGGCLSLSLTVSLPGTTLHRQIGTTVLPKRTPLHGTLTARKAQAADRIAASPGFEPAVAALLATRGENPRLVAQVLDTALTSIEARHDCSDFTILPLLRLWRDARDRLAPALQDRLRTAILNWRYWLDEPGDDVMWFWSENHVLCFHTAQYLAGKLFPDEVFPNSGRTGRDQTARAAPRLHRWFDAVREHGLCEYNSAAYYPIDLLGLLTLHDMAPDLRRQAAQAMDRLFIMAALHTCGGTPAGTQGRCYEKELLAGPATELGSVMAVALGTAFAPGYDRATALFCLSDYAPPDRVHSLAQPEPGQTVTARYTQGLDHAARLTLWKSATAQLATATGLPPGTQGHQAQIIDAHLACHPMARLWINHPGEHRPWGARRPSLLAGSHVVPAVVQDGPLALLIWDIDRDWTDIPFTQVFADPQAFGPVSQAGRWLVFGDTIAVWCSAPLTLVTTGLYQNTLWRAYAPRVGWAVLMRGATEAPDRFHTRLTQAAPVFDPSTLTLTADIPDLPRLTLSHNTQPPFTPLSPVPHIATNTQPLTAWRDPDG